MPEATRIRIPRWIQLVGLPVVLLLAFLLARTLGHVLFLFLTAAVIAFTLNPLVRELTRRRLPRGLSVALVSTLFATVVHRDHRRARDRRRLRDALRGRADRRVPDRGGRGLGPDRGRGRRRPAPGLARRPRPRGNQDRAAARRPHRVDRRRRRLGLRAGRDLVRAGRRALGDPPPLLDRARRRDHDLHAPRHAAARARDRPPLPARRGAAAHTAHRAGAVGLRPRPGDPLGGDRDERRRRDVDPRQDRPRRGRRPVRAPLRDLDGVRRGDPVHRPVALGRPAGPLRARRRPGRGALGRGALRLHLPGGGPRRRPERHGERAPAPPAPRHLRAPRRRRAVRDPGRARRAAHDGRRPGDLGVLPRADRPRAVGRGGAGRRRRGARATPAATRGCGRRRTLRRAVRRAEPLRFAA